MMRFARLIAFFVIIISAITILYGGYTFALTRHLTHAMAVSAKVPVSFSRVKPFLDGVVIDRVQLGKDVKLSTLYFEAYPWDMLRNRVKHIYIKEAKIYGDELLHKPIIWPFLHSIPLTVENVLFTTNFMDQPVTLIGEMKQSPNIPLLFKMKSTSPELDMHLQGEIRTDNAIIQSIDIEFVDAQTSFSTFETKRGAGWISLTFDQDVWNIVSEMDFGSVHIPHHALFDMSVKLSGTTNHLDFSATAKDRKTDQSWVIERNNDQIDVRYREQVKTLVPEKFQNAFLQKIGSLMTTFTTVEKQPEVKISDIKIIEKKKPQKNKTTKIEKPKAEIKKAEIPLKEDVSTQEDGDPQQVVPVQETVTQQAQEQEPIIPERIIYVPIDDLTGNSIFAGFTYDRHLVFMKRVCVDENENECWIARGQGGSFGYNKDDPWQVPPYFSRLSDYREATKLRGLLHQVTISSLVLSGDQNGVRDMIVQGFDAHGRKVYIELSLTGLSVD